MRVILVSALLTGCLVSVAAAQDVKAQQKLTVEETNISKMFVNCVTDKAKAKATLNFGANATTLSKESGTAYLSSTCKKYVVDIKVSSDASQLSTEVPNTGGKWLAPIYVWGDDSALQGKIVSGSGQLNGVKKAGCNSFTQSVAIYLKASGSDKFELARAYSRKGAWQPPQENVSKTGWCKLTDTGNDSALEVSAPASGDDLYRVAVTSTMNSKARKVKVGVQHGYDNGIH